jgi:hypothetical protein
MSGSSEETTSTSSNVPFTILKIETTTTTHLQHQNKDGVDVSRIPEIQIPENKNSAFHVN